jgi:DNA-binding MarR family transcriptional regulator
MDRLQKAHLTDADLMARLLNISQQLKDNFEELLCKYKLNYDGYYSLTAINNMPFSHGLLYQVADVTATHPGKQLRVIKTLIKAGCVECIDKNLSLNARLQLTMNGREIVKAIGEYEAYHELSFASLNAVEKVSLYNLLAKVQAPWILQALG